MHWVQYDASHAVQWVILHKTPIYFKSTYFINMFPEAFKEWFLRYDQNLKLRTVRYMIHS